MGCTHSNLKARRTTEVIRNPKLLAQHSGEYLEKLLSITKRESIKPEDTFYLYNDLGPPESEVVECEVVDVLTDELSSDSFETCDTQTDEEPKDVVEDEEKEEVLVPERMRDEKFMAGRVALKLQRSAERSAERKKLKAEQAELSSLRKQARASRRRARIEQRKAELKARRAHAQELAMQHETLCQNYEDQVRQDKENQLRKEESRYRILWNIDERHGTHSDGEDDDIGDIFETPSSFTKRVDKDNGRRSLSDAMDDSPTQSPKVVRASMDRLVRDLGRRAQQPHTATDIRNSGKSSSAFADHCNRRHSIQVDSTTSPDVAGDRRRSASFNSRRSAAKYESQQVSSAGHTHQKRDKLHGFRSAPLYINGGTYREGGYQSHQTSSIYAQLAARSEGSLLPGATPMRPRSTVSITHSNQSRFAHLNDVSGLTDVSDSLNRNLRRRTFEGAALSSKCLKGMRIEGGCFEKESDSRLGVNLGSDSLEAFEQQGHGGGEEIKSSIRDSDAVPSAQSCDRIINTKLADIEDTENREDNPLYKQMFAILQPAFDKKILCEGRMKELIDADDGLPIAFIASLLNIYKQEQRDTLELIRKSLYEGDSSTQPKCEVVFADTGLLVEKMRISAMNLGDKVVEVVCTELQQICVDEDLVAYSADGPGKWADLVEASKISAAYFKRLLNFIKTQGGP